MTVPVPPVVVHVRLACLHRMARYYHVCRLRLDVGLHKFVREGEQDAERMRRRLHIHVCLLGGSGLISFFGGPVLGTDVVGGISVTAILVSELFDYLGQF